MDGSKVCVCGGGFSGEGKRTSALLSTIKTYLKKRMKRVFLLHQATLDGAQESV